MVDSITAGTSAFDITQRAADAAAANSETASERVSSDYQDFLLLMTTQMKNQDPLKPIDSTDFVSQLAQFSGVEQQVNMNQKLDDLLVSFNNGQFDEAALYLGKAITAPTGKFFKEDGATPPIEYSAPDTATSGRLEIYNQADELVSGQEIAVGSGTKLFNWDGIDRDGNEAQDGIYRAELIFSDFGGNEVSRDPAITKSRVTEVIKTDSGFELKTQTGDIVSLNDVSRLADSVTE